MKDDSKVSIVTLEMSGLPPHVDEGYIKRNFFKGQHIIKFETQRDNLSGRCQGKGLVEIRCQGMDEGKKFLDTLEQTGVQFKVKAMRNLRKEGPTTSAVAVNPAANHINTRDMDEQVRNSWLQDMKKRDERKEKLLKEMKDQASS